MHPSRLLVAAAVCLGLASPAPLHAQDAQAPSLLQTMPVFSTDEIQLTVFTPEHMPARELLDTVSNLLRRQFLLEENGARQQPPQNLQLIGDSILIYDTAAYTRRIMDSLEALDRADVAAAAAERNAIDLLETDLGLLEYRPRNVTVNALAEALAPYSTTLEVAVRPGRNRIKVRTVNASSSQGLVVVRHTPAVLAEVRGLLERLDVPSPHVSLTCAVLQATREAGSDDLDPELVAGLSELVPYDHFERLTTGIITSAVRPGTRLRLEMLTGAALRAELELDPQAYDAAARTLTLERAAFQLRDPGAPSDRAVIASFSTGLALHAGEWVVLGASGPEPIFVVLRLGDGGAVATSPRGAAR